MKNIYFLLGIMFLSSLSSAQNITFTDPNFKSALLNISVSDQRAKDLNGNWCVVDSNGDAQIQLSEAENLSWLNVSNRQISEMNEIINFTNLTYLKCSGNSLTSLDVSACTALTELICDGNDLTSLDVSGCTALNELVCYNNNLTTLDVSSCTALTDLHCRHNDLTALDVSGLTSLTELICYSNFNLTSLDASGCTALILLYCQSNNLTSLDVSDCTALTELVCGGNDLTSLDVSACTALTELKCNNNSLTSLDVSTCTALTELDCSLNDLTSLDVSGLTALTELDCLYNNLTSLDASGCTALTKLICYLNELTSLDVSGCTALTWLDCHNNNLTSLDVSACTALIILSCYNNNLTSLDVSSCTVLTELECRNNDLTSLDVSGCTALTELSCYNNNLTSLDVSSCTALTWLDCYNNNLTSLDVSGCTALTILRCYNNNLTSLDVSNCTALNHLKCNANNLIYLNISNTALNQNDIYYLNLQANNYLEVCCDVELYESMFNYLQTDGYENCILNVGEDCSSINQSFVSISLDADNNGCDANDESIDSFGVNLTSTTQNTDFEFFENSNFTIYSVGNEATITPLINSNYYTFTPAFYEVDYTQGNFETLDFCIAPIGVYNDVEMAIIPIDDARPGFDVAYKLIYKNKGTTTLSGNVQLTFEDDYMDLVSATPAVDSQGANTLSWNYTDLAPFESREILFTMELNAPTDSNFPLNDGDILSFHALVNPIDTDETPIDNIATLRQEVVNSYDPNDKMLLEGSQILPEMVGEYVHYRIRFENTGTANAINIIVEDTIDPTKFDISTLEVVDASHSVRTVIEDDLVKFQFYNINLPFDDANNDGYVVFKIKTLDTLALNDTFSNQAEIYFDYNAPIVTNNFTTTIVENLGTEDVESPSAAFTLSPNPAKDFFTIQTSEVIQKVELFDASGRLVKSFIGNATQYDVSSISNGIYMVKVYSENQTENLQLLKK